MEYLFPSFGDELGVALGHDVTIACGNAAVDWLILTAKRRPTQRTR
jgi:hypothetical protein